MFKSFKSASALGQLRKADKLKWLRPQEHSKSEEKSNAMKNRSRSVDTKTVELRHKSALVQAEQKNSTHKSYNDLDKRTALSLSPDSNFEFGNDLSKVVSNIDFKTLGEKSDLEREKLNKIMKKLEEDLMNAKIDLLEEENVKQLPNLFSNISTNNTPIKSKHNLYNKASLSNSYSSTLSTSTSGIVTTTGASSSSSSVSTSPPLHIQQKNLLPTRPKTPEPALPNNGSKNIQLLIMNKPRRLPRRRHTIASRNECSVRTVVPSSSECSLTDENDDYGYVEYSKTPKSFHKKNKPHRVINENFKTVKLASKSITNLIGSIEKTSWTNPQTNLDSCLCQEAFAYASSPSRGAPIVLNLSPLSLSASSITTSDSDEDNKFTLKSLRDNETLKLTQNQNAATNCNHTESML